MVTPSKDAPGLTAIADLSDDQRREIAEKKATCPFIASVVVSGELPVHNGADRPLAAIDKVASTSATPTAATSARSC